MKIVNNWLPPVIWAFVIFLFSSLQVGSSSEIYWQDFLFKKTAHIIEYAILAILLYRALINSNVDKRKAIVVSMIVAGLYGLSDEFHQSFTPGREPRIRDVFIDTIGGTIGGLWAKRYL